MVDQRLEEIDLAGNRQLQHHLLAGGQLVEVLEDLVAENPFRLLLVGNRDRHLGLDDRHQALGENLAAKVELLGDIGGDARGGGSVDDRAHLGAEDAFGNGTVEQLVEVRHRLHQAHAVMCVGKALVDLEEGHHALVFPQEGGNRLAVDVAVHGAFEEDGADHAVAVEGGRLDDAGAHGMHQREHFLVGLPGVLADAVAFERLGRRTAGLVESGDEALAG